MGYDPITKSGTGAFPGDNHLVLAVGLVLGTTNRGRLRSSGCLWRKPGPDPPRTPGLQQAQVSA